MTHNSSTKKLSLVLVITFLIFTGEVIGGFLSNSLALLSDAGHVFTDALAILLSLIASIISRRPSGSKATYGYQKIGILAALINGVSLIIIALIIFIEGYRRFINPPSIDSYIMLPVAVFGFIGNLLMAKILEHKHEDLNLKSAWLHVIGDTISSAAVIISALIIKFTGWLLVDPLASWLVGLIIIFGGIRVVKESLLIFLDFTPKGFNLDEIAHKIKNIKGVKSIHDIHIWSIGSGIYAFSSHVVVDVESLEEGDKIRMEVEKQLKELGIKHTVIQIEKTPCENKNFFCEIENYRKHHLH